MAKLSEQGRFQAKALDVPVFPNQRRIEIRILVPAVRSQSFRRYPEDNRPPLPVPLNRRLEGPERPSPEPGTPAVLVEQQGPLAVQMDRRSGRILLSRLQPLGFLPIIKGDHRQAVRGEPAQVHLHVLGVVHLDPVQEDTHVFAAETPDIHRLQAAHASVVLDLDAGEAAQDVGDLGGRRLRARQVHRLGGFHHGIDLHGPDRRGIQRVRLLGLQAPGGGQGGCQRYDGPLQQINTRRSAQGRRRRLRSSAWRLCSNKRRCRD